MTLSSSLEAALRRRPPSSSPARAASALLGVAPVDEQGEQRFNRIVHWGYGTMWGAARGLLGYLGIENRAAGFAHLTAVWGGEQVVLPATGVSRAAWTWTRTEAAVDLVHHVVYVVVTDATYRWLRRR